MSGYCNANTREFKIPDRFFNINTFEFGIPERFLESVSKLQEIYDPETEKEIDNMNEKMTED